MTVEYHPAVQLELEEIRDWDNGRVPGLGGEFIDEFERQVLRIAASVDGDFQGPSSGGDTAVSLRRLFSAGSS